MRRGSTKTVCAAILLAVFLGSTIAFLPAPALAAGLGCGATITKPTALSVNIGPCLGKGLIIGHSGITLNCAGHTISGGVGSDVGITLNGVARVTVENCHVSGFLYGFELTSASDNKLAKNTANGNGCFGFELYDSVGNSITTNTAERNGFGGFAVNDSSANALVKNTADRNPEGFLLFMDSGITLVSNAANSNRYDGFSIVGSSANTLAMNVADNNGGPGFSISYDSFNNKLAFNTGNGNTISGFDVDSFSSANVLTSNTANSNTMYGYRDFSTGSGTAGTANFYSLDECTVNLVGSSTPTGLCTPQP